MSRFALIEPETLELKITDAAPRRGAVVPLDVGPSRRDLARGETYAAWIAQRVLYDGLYPEHSRVQSRLERTRKGAVKLKASAAFPPPEPWLVALAAIMWQGILGGASWDVVKLAVKSALAKLEKAGVAPPAGLTRERALRLGFHWVSYRNGRKQHSLFLGLQRSYREKPAKTGQRKPRSRPGRTEKKVITTRPGGRQRR